MRPRVLKSALVAGGLLVALSGCGAGLEAQTYQERTAADAANTAVGALAVRNLRLQPPTVGDRFAEGQDAVVELTVVNKDDVGDRLVEATSPAAAEVVQEVDGSPGTIEVPPIGSTVNSGRLLLRDLTRDLFTGENVEIRLRFERAGEVEVYVPVGLTGTSDRPVFNPEPGGEGDPALGGPGGGHEEPETSEETDPADTPEG